MVTAKGETCYLLALRCHSFSKPLHDLLSMMSMVVVTTMTTTTMKMMAMMAMTTTTPV